MAACTGRTSSHTDPPTSIDHEKSGARRRLMPGARRVSTVVTTETVATASATITAISATT